VAEFEAARRRTPLTGILRSVGRTRSFAAVYRLVGPRLDPWLMHRSAGRMVSRLYGLPALLLVATGARSKESRTSALLYLRDGEDFAVVGTNFGQPRHPAWTVNLLARPEATVEVGPVRLAVVAELADGATWNRLWPAFCDVYPGYADYLGRSAGRVPRLFLLHPTGLGPPS
jgi:deazaflavin-dependent oxidoreductase (nitroreductase family)